jgi:uncharacterized membrane protein YdjX (TVP38/TMEM64 family)
MYLEASLEVDLDAEQAEYLNTGKPASPDSGQPESLDPEQSECPDAKRTASLASMLPPDNPARSGKRWTSGLWAIIGFPFFIAMVAVLAWSFRDPLSAILRSSEQVRTWLTNFGFWAPLAFMALQLLQVVIFVIPGEIVQLAGGFAFGLWGGTLWSSLGILVGSLVNFMVGRLLGRPFVAALFGPERLGRIESATSGGRAMTGFALLFVIPGLPKDAFTYAAGASGLSLWRFILVSGLGRLPGILGSSFIGAAVYDGQFGAALVVSAIAAVVFVFGLVYRKACHNFIHHVVVAIGRQSSIPQPEPQPAVPQPADPRPAVPQPEPQPADPQPADPRPAVPQPADPQSSIPQPDPPGPEIRIHDDQPTGLPDDQ